MTLDYRHSPNPSHRLHFPPAELAAWAIILLSVVIIIAAPRWSAKAKTPPSDAPEFQVLLSARYFVGLNALQPTKTAGPLAAALDSLDETAKTPADKLRVAIVRGEIQGKDEALKHCDTLAQNFPSLAPDINLLKGIYAGTVDPSSAEWSQFRNKNGWFADLAQVTGKPPTDPLRQTVLQAAERTLAGLLGLVIAAGLLGIVGLPLLIVGLVQYARGKLLPRFNTARALPADRRAYIQGFAIYLAIFAAAGLIARGFLALPPTAVRIILLAALPVGFLAAVSWPLLRGQSWRDWRQTLGLHADRGLFREFLSGIAGYAAGAPIAGAGMLLSFILIKISGKDASHPALQGVTGSHLEVLLLFLLACVFAPITEELMFRGALFSHLRQRFGFLFSGGLSAIIFAAIHPQGWPAIPALAALGFVFAGIREWRGSIFGGMTAHALNNAAVMTALLVMVS